MPLETSLSGTPLSAISFSVPPLAAHTVLASEPTVTSLKVGTVRIALDARITAYALIRGVGPQLTVYPAAPARNVIFDVRRTMAAGISTGTALANLSEQPASVTLRLHKETGEEAFRVARTLAAGEQLSRFMHQLFPELENADFTGTASVRSTQQHAVAVSSSHKSQRYWCVPTVTAHRDGRDYSRTKGKRLLFGSGSLSNQVSEIPQSGRSIKIKQRYCL